jgi:hypothetical protein
MSPSFRSRLIVGLAVSFCILLPCASAAAFPDVPAGHPNADAIEYVQAQGIVQGYSDGTYHPDDSVNRAEFTKILVGSLSLSSDEKAGCFGNQQHAPETESFDLFTDVQEGHWFWPFVCVARSRSMVQGYADGSFKPENGINFAEAAKIVTTAFGFPSSQTDVCYEGYVRALAEKSAIPASITSFNQPVTRGEMAEMIYRLKTAVTGKPSQTYETLQAMGNTANSVFVIPEWGIQFDTPKGMSDLRYSYQDFGEDSGIDFITQKVIDFDKATGGQYCVLGEGETPLGGLARVKTLNPDGYYNSEREHVLVGGYNYFYDGPQSSCSGNADVQNLLAIQGSAIHTAILKSLRVAVSLPDAMSVTVYVAMRPSIAASSSTSR